MRFRGLSRASASRRDNLHFLENFKVKEEEAHNDVRSGNSSRASRYETEPNVWSDETQKMLHSVVCYWKREAGFCPFV